MIHGSRVKVARELRGLTQTELAGAIGVTQPNVAQIEAGRIQPSQDVLSAVALKTGFPPPFFEKEPQEDFSVGTLLFRAHKTLTARQQKQAHRYGQVIFEIAAHMAEQLNPNPVRLPHVEGETSPKTAAALTRAALGLDPDAPIGNLLNALERGGVFVFGLPIQAENRSAFATWAGRELERPIIAVFGGQPGDRLRLSVAHEVGHLVMHKSANGDVEKEAFLFAGEFLMPETSIREEMSPPVTLTDLAALKPRWKVSVQALAMRARELEIVTDRQTRYLFQQMGKRGWRKKEPASLDVPVERPRALKKMAELLYGVPIDFKRLASGLDLSAGFVQEIVDPGAPILNGQTFQGSARILPFPQSS